MPFITKGGLILGLNQKAKPWDDRSVICYRPPVAIAIDGCNHCYGCGHHIDLHFSAGQCSFCVDLNNRSYMPTMGKIPKYTAPTL